MLFVWVLHIIYTRQDLLVQLSTEGIASRSTAADRYASLKNKNKKKTPLFKTADTPDVLLRRLLGSGEGDGGGLDSDDDDAPHIHAGPNVWGVTVLDEAHLIKK